MNPQIHEAAFNLMVGEQIGKGVNRTVYSCWLSPDWVVKVQHSNGNGYFQNIMEYRLWMRADKKQRRWLAPVKWISACGQVLIMQRTHPIPPSYKLPSRMPDWLCDFKRTNYGLLNGVLVCHDYGLDWPTSVALDRNGSAAAEWRNS